jgi:hypothetical protein
VLIIKQPHLPKTVAELKAEIADLKAKNATLKTLLGVATADDALNVGRMAELIVNSLVGGTLTRYASHSDIKTPEGDKIQVKYSKVRTPNKDYPKTHTWNWSNIKAKEEDGRGYHFLVLLGKKDANFPCQSMDTDTTPYGKYVCFFIPLEEVAELMPEGKDSGMVNTNTDREKVTSSQSKQYSKSKKLWGHMKKLEDLPALIKGYKSTVHFSGG